jgi:predicted membrane-bound spermidine synthase
MMGPVLFSIAAVAGYLVMNRVPFDLVKLAWEPRQIGYLILSYLILAVPFFFVGLTVAAAFMRRAQKAGTVYFADLLGATTGAWIPLMLYPLMGANGAVIFAGLLGLVSSLCLWTAERPQKFGVGMGLSFGPALVLLMGYILVPAAYDLKLSPYKGLMTALRYPGAKLLATRWNVLSRVDVLSSPAVRFAPGLSLSYAGELPSQIGVTTDGDQLHAITAYDGLWRPEHDFLRYLPAAAPYFLTTPSKALVIEPGGGLEVFLALYFDAKTIVVLERNPLLPEVVRRPAASFPSRIYDDPRVKIHLGEARSYLQSKGSSEFELIVFSPLHALGAGGFGLYGFAEDYSQTIEAVSDYYRHLSDGGWLVVTRYLLPLPLQEARWMATLIEALEDLKGPVPDRQLVILRSWNTMTLLIKRGAITPSEIEKLKAFSDSNRFDLDYYPGIHPSEVNRFNRFPEPIYFQLAQKLLSPEQREGLYRTYSFDIRPVSDDRPFFGYILKFSTLKETYSLVREKWLFFIEGGYLLPVMLLQAMVWSLLFILIPVRWSASGGSAGPDKASPRGNGGSLIYFLLIAVGFMGVEIAMIQRFILFLGHPVYAVSIVLGSVLFFAGMGSLLTTRIQATVWHRRLLLILSVLVLLEGVGLPGVLSSLMGLSEEIRFLLAVVFIAPLGILMGMPFPLGMGFLARSGRTSLIPWAWAVNGSISVVAAILTAMVAMEVGFTVVFGIAASAYFLAAWIRLPVAP